jgi:hypothetical protein
MVTTQPTVQNSNQQSHHLAKIDQHQVFLRASRSDHPHPHPIRTDSQLSLAQGLAPEKYQDQQPFSKIVGEVGLAP